MVAAAGRMALATGGAVTRALARHVLADLPGFGGEEQAGEEHDVSVASPGDGSNPMPKLL